MRHTPFNIIVGAHRKLLPATWKRVRDLQTIVSYTVYQSSDWAVTSEDFISNMLLWQSILWLNTYSNTRTTPIYIFKTINIHYATSPDSCLHNIHSNSPFYVTIVNTNPITHDAFKIYIGALITLFSRLYLLCTIKAQLINYSSHTSIFEQHLIISLRQSTYTLPLCQLVFATVLQTHGYSPFFSVIVDTNSTRHNQIISFIVTHRKPLPAARNRTRDQQISVDSTVCRSTNWATAGENFTSPIKL